MKRIVKRDDGEDRRQSSHLSSLIALPHPPPPSLPPPSLPSTSYLHLRDAKSGEHGEHARAIFFMSCAIFCIVETQCLFNVLIFGLWICSPACTACAISTAISIFGLSLSTDCAYMIILDSWHIWANFWAHCEHRLCISANFCANSGMWILL